MEHLQIDKELNVDTTRQASFCLYTVVPEANGILHVTAFDHGSRSKSTATFPLEKRSHARGAEIERALANAEVHWKQRSAIEELFCTTVHVQSTKVERQISTLNACL